MQPIDLVELRPGYWVAPEKPETYWQMWRRDWRLLLAVHVPGFTACMLLEHWLR